MQVRARHSAITILPILDPCGAIVQHSGSFRANRSLRRMVYGQAAEKLNVGSNSCWPLLGHLAAKWGRDWRAILAVGAVSGTMQGQRFGTPDKELFGEDSRPYGRFS